MKARDPYVVALQRAATLDHKKLQPHQLHKSRTKAATMLSKLQNMVKPAPLLATGAEPV